MAWLRLAMCLIATVLVDTAAAEAQQAGRVYKVGWLWSGRPGHVTSPPEKWTGAWGAFRDTMRDNGFVLGKNLVIEERHGHGGDTARLASAAEALVSLGVDVIIPAGTPPTVAAMRAAKRIPIVFWGVGDAVEKGLIESLARPGGNMTGMAVMIAFAKQWELLHQIAPDVRRAASLSTSLNRLTGERAAAFGDFALQRMKADASAVGIEAFRLQVGSLAEVEAKFAELSGDGRAGVLVVNDGVLVEPEWRSPVMEMAVKHRLPTSCAQVRNWALSGCLVTYAEDWEAMARGMAAQVVKVLRGVAPAEIPVQQPTDYKLIINAKTAKALDLAVPLALLARADEVIE